MMLIITCAGGGGGGGGGGVRENLIKMVRSGECSKVSYFQPKNQYFF